MFPFFFSILNEKCEECDTGKKEGGKGKNDEGIKELVSFRGEKGEFKLSLSELEEKKKKNVSSRFQNGWLEKRKM